MLELVVAVFVSSGVSWAVCHKYISVGMIDRKVDKRARDRVEVHHLHAVEKQRAVHNESKHLNISSSQILRNGDEMLVAIRQLTEKNIVLEARCDDLLEHAKNVLHTALYGNR